ncbi:MAG: sporulation transcription factor Spo0A [Bacilli bacterium]|nr:sporulation transcription factor Spo0A [Bacilli bacterium]
MKKSINALVVDDNKEFTSRIEEYFKNNESIQILDVLSDGSSVVDYVKKNQDKIDLILLDLILPNVDGIEILSQLKRFKIQKHVIVLSSYKQEYMVSMMSKFQVDYFMLKPCSFPSLEKRIKEVFTESMPDLTGDKKVSPSIQLKVSSLLHDLGVPSQVMGYQYLREGILMLYQSSSLIGAMTKEVYPTIAKRYNTTSSRVERAIRHAIEISWNRADYDMMNAMFGHSIDYDRAKPTNSEFIATISDALRIEEIKNAYV